jgi:DNA polymerase I-like protein with 3'-5' exonuclease and polymerase domains/uracil-DNA glycosylase
VYLKMIKPSSCSGCSLYKTDKMVNGGGVRPSQVTFISSGPPPWGGLFTDNGGKILKHIISDLAKNCTDADREAITLMAQRHFLMYSVCCPGSTVNETVDKCKSSVSGNMLAMSQPKVVVAIGKEACHFMGISGNITDIRGTVHTTKVSGVEYKVVPTLPLSMLDDKPGLYEIVKSDIRKAALTANGSSLDDIDVDALIKGYDIPRSLEEAVAVLNKYSSYAGSNKEISQTLMSLDFETTSLFAWDNKARVIAMSGSVEPGMAFAVMVDHKDSSYRFRDIAPYVVKVLNSKHPKAWWNYKYDYGFARYCLTRQILEECDRDASYSAWFEKESGISIEEIVFRGPVNNTRWDGMLGEHMLQEDKKGFYSLKEVVTEYYPSLVGYEEKLQNLLQKAKEQVVATELSNYLSRNPNSCEGIVLSDSSPMQWGFDLTNAEDICKAKVKEFKRLARLKKTPEEEKAAYEDAANILTNWISVIHEECKIGKDEVSRWLRSLESTLGSSGDPRRGLVTFEAIDIDVMLPYAAIDADLTLRISNNQRLACLKEDPVKKAAAENRPPLVKLMDNHYIPLTEVLCEMQVEGVRVDKDFLRSSLIKLEAESRELEKEIVETVKVDLNRDITPADITSTSTLADLLIAGYNLPKIKDTSGGAVSTDREAMQKYSDMGNKLAGLVLKYRDNTKASSTYIESLLDMSEYDGRIHGAIHLNGTATGRASSSNPNLQNITADLAGLNIKSAFVPTNTKATTGVDYQLCKKYGWTNADELTMVDIDFAGAEIRGLTAYVKDEQLIDALKRSLDMHSWIASMIFNEDYDTINKLRKTDDKYHQMRQKAKTIVFGLIYGISNKGLSDRLNITIEEADSLMSVFFSRFPKIEEYINITKAKVTREGILRTPTGRARRFPMAQMGGQFESRNHRQGINYLVQSFCAEIVLRLINHLRHNLSKIRGRLVLTVHDSIVMEIPITEVGNLQQFLSSHIDTFITTNFPQLPVSMPYDIKLGKSYGEAE